jgi:glycosyltransferase involved in cell wall biosynthesis
MIDSKFVAIVEPLIPEVDLTFNQYGNSQATPIPKTRNNLAPPPTSSQHEKTLPKVAILLCTYHGQQYLADQLDSFTNQSYKNWEVWASDDGSQDHTHEILVAYREKLGADRFSIHNGPEEGFVANFLSLSCHASIHADCYAYSDQDDVWETDKLERAVNWLLTVPKDVPALYCSRTRLVDKQNQHIGFSPLFKKAPSFANALMQNVGGGNTMVMNDTARKLLSEAGEDVDVITHDWWVYILVSGCGGKVFYDAYPSIRYRQHGNNLVGMNSSWPARLIRIRKLLQGHYRVWNDRNIAALHRITHKLTPENRVILDQFAVARNRSLIPRLIGLWKLGIYRQTVLGNLGLIVAAFLKKL